MAVTDFGAEEPETTSLKASEFSNVSHDSISLSLSRLVRLI